MKLKGINSWPILACIATVILLSNCSSNKVQPNPVTETSICSGEKCAPTTQKYSSAQLLNGLQQILKTNEGQAIPICNADPKTHACKEDIVCYIVIGGIIPANGCAKNLIFSEVKTSEQDPKTQISMKTDMPLTFIGSQLHCDTATTTLSIKSENDISIVLQPYYCNWMVMGNMYAKFTFSIDSIDIDHGQIGGYWRHSVAGTGNGSGSGYAILKFPKNIPWQTLASLQK